MEPSKTIYIYIYILIYLFTYLFVCLFTYIRLNTFKCMEMYAFPSQWGAPRKGDEVNPAEFGA